MKVFQLAKVALASDDTWERRPSDEQDGKVLIDWVRKRPGCTDEHIKVLEDGLDTLIRFRPEEIAAAGSFRTRPVAFGNAELGGKCLASHAKRLLKIV